MILEASTLNITEAIIADAIGLFALFIAIFGSSYRLSTKTLESRIVFALIVTLIICCLLEPVAFWFDGGSGLIKNTNSFYRGLNVFSNTIIFTGNIFAACFWNAYVVIHLTGNLSKMRKVSLSVTASACLVSVIVNLFYPFLFEIDKMGVYHRGTWGYYIYATATIGVFIIDTCIAFVRIKLKGGLLKYFPMWLFVIPAMSGIITQLVIYGISTIYVGLALAVFGILMAMQNDLIFRDNLTGLYNRYYLDSLKSKMLKFKKKEQEYTAMMLDLNGFKQINDTFGHSVGDNALINTGRLLREVIGGYGVVIRYAGDEFIIVLNTQKDVIINELVNKINEAFDDFNNNSDEPYNLSIAIGFSKADFKNQTVAELMNDIDKRMFEEKKRQHLEHPEWDRRQ